MVAIYIDLKKMNWRQSELLDELGQGPDRDHRRLARAACHIVFEVGRRAPCGEVVSPTRRQSALPWLPTCGHLEVLIAWSGFDQPSIIFVLGLNVDAEPPAFVEGTRGGSGHRIASSDVDIKAFRNITQGAPKDDVFVVSRV